MHTRKLVLLAEGDRDLRELAALVLRRDGYGVLEAATAARPSSWPGATGRTSPSST
jgi:hypothetical protein